MIRRRAGTNEISSVSGRRPTREGWVLVQSLIGEEGSIPSGVGERHEVAGVEVPSPVPKEQDRPVDALLLILVTAAVAPDQPLQVPGS